MPRVELFRPPSMTPPTGGGGQLVLTFLCLDSAQDQIAYLEGQGVNPPGVISLERLLVPCRSCDGNVH
jgi:hypothetical protein